MLSFSLSELVLAILNFVILLLVLKLTVFKKLTAMMSERKSGIETALNDAALARQEVASTKEALELEIASARKEAVGLTDTAQVKALEVRDSILAEARLEAQDLLDKARLEINREQEEALKELKKDLAEMVVSATARLLDEEMTPGRHSHLKEKVISQMEEAGGPLQ